MTGSPSSQQLLEQLLAEIEDEIISDEGATKNKSLFNFSTDLTDQDLIVLVSVLSGFSKSDFYVKLYSLFGRETILFLSMFNSNSIKIPDIRYLLKLKKFSKIYLYIKSYEFSEDGYLEASRKFRKPTEDLKRITGKVDTCMKQFRDIFHVDI
jgi:hypothetical protein